MLDPTVSRRPLPSEAKTTIEPSPYPHYLDIKRPKAYSVPNAPMVLAAMHALKELGYLGKNLNSADQNSYLQAATDLLISQGLLRESITGRGKSFQLTERGKEYMQDQEMIEIMHDTYADIMVTVENIAGLQREVEAEPYSVKTYLDFEGDIDQKVLDAWIVPALSLLELLKTNAGMSLAEALLINDGFALNDVRLTDESQRQEFAAFLTILCHAGIISQNGDKYQQVPRKRSILRVAGYALLALSYYQVMQELDKLINGEKKYGIDQDLYRQAEMNAHASNADMALRVGPTLTDILAGRDSFDGFEEALNPKTVIDYGSGGGEVLMRFVEGAPSIEKAYGLDFNPRTVKAAQGIIKERGLTESITCLHGSIIDEESMRKLKEQIEADGQTPGIANICAIMHDVGHKAAKEFLELHAKVFGDTPLIITEALKVPLNIKTQHPDYRPASFEFMHGISGQEQFYEQELLQLLDECGYKILGTKVYSSIGKGKLDEKQTVGVSYLVQHKS